MRGRLSGRSNKTDSALANSVSSLSMVVVHWIPARATLGRNEENLGQSANTRSSFSVPGRDG